MPQMKYRIYELSARTLMSYAREENGVYTFQLNRTAMDHCKIPGAKHEQDDCAMFFQLMCQLRGDAIGSVRRTPVSPTLRMSFSIWTSPASLIVAAAIAHSSSAEKKRETCFGPMA